MLNDVSIEKTDRANVEFVQKSMMMFYEYKYDYVEEHEYEYEYE